MTGPELRAAFELIFGEQWRIPASNWLRIDVRTVERQVLKDEPDGPIVAAVTERIKLEDIRRSHRKRQERWIDRGRRMGKFQRAILENAAAGLHLLTGRPAGGQYVGTWEAATRHCMDQGWLDEDRAITDEGREALSLAAVPKRNVHIATPD